MDKVKKQDIHARYRCNFEKTKANTLLKLPGTITLEIPGALVSP